MIDLKDEQLLAGSEAGDGEGFAELVRRHQKGLYDLLKRLTLDHAAACDLAQKTWIKVYRSRFQFQGRSSFKTWLFAIALNHFRDWKRKKKADWLVPASQAGKDGTFKNWIESKADPAPLALEVLVKNERQARILAAMDRLPENHRRVLALIFQQGLSIREAAGLLKKTPENVKTTSYRALSKLRELIGDDHE